MKRRTFLTAAASGVGAAIVVGPWIRRSHAAPFGTFPGGTSSVQLPDGERAKKILEVFLYGGLSTWETLYFVRDYGTATDPQFPNTQYYAYTTENAAALTTCGGTNVSRPFAADENGAMVELGPFAGRLDTRPDLTSRMRL
ncbi:MAG TPA: twin-arginine translocation signal domain-containing protein, partial [Kofleriaceae bacterium]|nr:twin-arginine translocation signal domain-containing protein [Kofleriaceae bacterium]